MFPAGMAYIAGCCGNVMEPLENPSTNHRSREAVKVRRVAGTLRGI